jgi:hypothetical protein
MHSSPDPGKSSLRKRLSSHSSRQGGARREKNPLSTQVGRNITNHILEPGKEPELG